jgi:hypothetical protein
MDFKTVIDGYEDAISNMRWEVSHQIDDEIRRLGEVAESEVEGLKSSIRFLRQLIAENSGDIDGATSKGVIATHVIKYADRLLGYYIDDLLAAE